jgi:hypothetical protein
MFVCQKRNVVPWIEKPFASAKTTPVLRDDIGVHDDA